MKFCLLSSLLNAYRSAMHSRMISKMKIEEKRRNMSWWNKCLSYRCHANCLLKKSKKRSKNAACTVLSSLFYRLFGFFLVASIILDFICFFLVCVFVYFLCLKFKVSKTMFSGKFICFSDAVQCILFSYTKDFNGKWSFQKLYYRKE